MSLFNYHGSKVWTMDFIFQGQRIRETTQTTDYKLAKKIEAKRRRELEEGSAGIKKPNPPRIFSAAAKDWIEMKSITLAPKTILIERLSLAHLLPMFGRKLVCDIEAEEIARYQLKRLNEGAAPKSINLEIGTMRGILRRSGHWAALLPHVKMLKVNEEAGRSISPEEEKRLIQACRASSSKALAPFVILALETGARYNTIRMLQWKNVDLEERCLRWGKDKTTSGSHRLIPINKRATGMLSAWGATFPQRRPEHYVFPTEKAGKFEPARPVGTNKTAWNTAKRKAQVECRFHDLRHTSVSRMLDGGAPMAKVAKMVGWSASTTVNMVRRYGHFSLDQMREVAEMMSAGPVGLDVANQISHREMQAVG